MRSQTKAGSATYFPSASHRSQPVTDVMDRVWIRNAGDAYKDQSQSHNQRDIITQSVISIALGLVAFLAFCVSTLCDLTYFEHS